MYNHLLDAFIEVVDCGSFLKASEKLYISTTAVMKQMNSLEKQLGLTLLSRTNQGVELTDAGKSVYKDAKKMIQYSRAALQRANAIQDADVLTVRVGTSVLYPCKDLMDLWNTISDSYPQFKLRVVPFEDGMNGPAHRDLGVKFDLIAGVYNSTITNTVCNFLQLYESQFCLAMSRKHPLAKKQSLSLADLHNEHLMIMKPGNSPVNDQIRLDAEKEHPQIILEDAPYHYDIEVFNHCEDEGWILLSLDVWRDIHPSLITVPFDIPYTIPYGIIYSSVPTNDTVRFLNVVRKIDPQSSDG